MPMHNIGDNTGEKLVDHVNQILGTTGSARFAVGISVYPDEPLRGETCCE